jgi:hypothetical protein
MRRNPRQHDAPDLLRPRDRELRRDERTELETEHIDRPQSQAVHKVPHRAGKIGNRNARRGRIGRSVAGQIGRIDAAVVA